MSKRHLLWQQDMGGTKVLDKHNNFSLNGVLSLSLVPSALFVSTETLLSSGLVSLTHYYHRRPEE